MTRRAITGLAFAVALTVAGAAHAFGLSDIEGIWMPAGVALGGAATVDEPIGFVLGGELSLVGVFASGDESLLYWAGGVADATWNFGADLMRHRVGAEAGLWFFGLELAYLGELDDGAYRPGINVRVTANIPFVGIYGGYGHLFGEGIGSNLGEFGGYLKVPIPLSVEGDI